MISTSTLGLKLPFPMPVSFNTTKHHVPDPVSGGWLPPLDGEACATQGWLATEGWLEPMGWSEWYMPGCVWQGVRTARLRPRHAVGGRSTVKVYWTAVAS